MVTQERVTTPLLSWFDLTLSLMLKRIVTLLTYLNLFLLIIEMGVLDKSS